MTLYRIIRYDQEELRKGVSTEPVNFVGSHPLTWHESDVPEVGFIELTHDELIEYLQELLHEKIIADIDNVLADNPA
jgi:hypothetical protein